MKKALFLSVFLVLSVSHGQVTTSDKSNRSNFFEDTSLPLHLEDFYRDVVYWFVEFDEQTTNYRMNESFTSMYVHNNIYKLMPSGGPLLKFNSGIDSPDLSPALLQNDSESLFIYKPILIPSLNYRPAILILQNDYTLIPAAQEIMVLENNPASDKTKEVLDEIEDKVSYLFEQHPTSLVSEDDFVSSEDIIEDQVGIVGYLSDCVTENFGTDLDHVKQRLLCLGAPKFVGNLPLLIVIHWYAENEDIETLNEILSYSEMIIAENNTAKIAIHKETGEIRDSEYMANEGLDFIDLDQFAFTEDNTELVQSMSKHIRDVDPIALRNLISQKIDEEVQRLSDYCNNFSC